MGPRRLGPRLGKLYLKGSDMSIRLAIVDSALFEELLDVGYYILSIEEQDNGQAVAELAREF